MIPSILLILSKNLFHETTNPMKYRNSYDKIVICVSAIGVLHFTISLLIWGFGLFAACKLAKDGNMDWKCFIHAIPAVLLFLFFMVSFILACRGFRKSLYVLIVSISLTIISFSYDAINRNYQLHAESMTGKNQGGTFKYCTWWWYSHY